MTQGLERVEVSAIYEHDPWVEINPELQASLEKLGFVQAITHFDGDDFIVAWYHPDHWYAWQDIGCAPPEGATSPGDVWINEWAFQAKTPEAKKFLKEE
jgi:hypothetical protein